MSKRSFRVKAIWDAENEIWISESDIIGLHIEAESLPEFEDLVAEFAADLIVSNHYSAEDLSRTPFRDLIPTVLIQEAKPPFAAE